ncbi:MAG: alkane 1-monooxygenase, partial [Betaproteobacteria bacterium]|nr:alkane 1-monooxygenase [Betaproteobacteria bacterium]
LLIIFGVTTVLDYLIGRDTVNVAPGKMPVPGWFRLLPLLCVPLQFAVLGWATYFFVTTPLGLAGQLGWVASVGAVSGMLAINVGHELIHKRSRLEQWAGGLLLSSVGYGTFKIEHVLGHHAWVATDHDPSSAKRGESVYGFVPRAIARNIANGFHLQAARLQRTGVAFWSWRNELLWWSGVTIGLGAASAVVFGVMGLLFFGAQGLVAIVHLEIVNYIEHYGLRRNFDTAGRPERVTPMHSWNSSYFLSNAYLFQLQRHSDHHAHAARPYQDLQHHTAAPQLPGGYGAMLLLALVPPLWMRVMDPRIPATMRG